MYLLRIIYKNINRKNIVLYYYLPKIRKGKGNIYNNKINIKILAFIFK